MITERFRPDKSITEPIQDRTPLGPSWSLFSRGQYKLYIRWKSSVHWSRISKKIWNILKISKIFGVENFTEFLPLCYVYQYYVTSESHYFDLGIEKNIENKDRKRLVRPCNLTLRLSLLGLENCISYCTSLWSKEKPILQHPHIQGRMHSPIIGKMDINI